MTCNSFPEWSAARRGSQFDPQITLSTFHPEPRKFASSSWMIFPFPRTGPSRRCRLQLMTNVRLSRPSRRERDPRQRLGLVHLAVAEERPDALLAGVADPAVLEVAVEAGLVHGGERSQPHRDR